MNVTNRQIVVGLPTWRDPSHRAIRQAGESRRAAVDVFALLFNDNGTCEIAGPASGSLVSLPCEESDSITSESVFATIDTER